MYVTDSKSLAAFIDRASECEVLAIDTEFLRERTYFPQLCLLQLATEHEVVIVDPFEVPDLTPLQHLFELPSLVKLFHAGRQDVEILYNRVGVMPNPVFDTQIAATLLGHTQQVGYGALVEAECGVHLRKIDSFTDWSRRPLSDSQVRYAADDVIYLPKMYESMGARLRASGRMQWLSDDFAQLVDPDNYDPKPRERFRRLKRVSSLSARQLSAAREVAEWREEKAIRKDIPRKWVMTDEQIVEACKRETRSLDSLYMVRGVKDKLSVSDARKVVSLVIAGLDLPKEEWPEKTPKSRAEINVDYSLDLMSALVRLRSKQHGIAHQTLANHDDLVAIARGKREDIALLTGWRKELVGDELVALVEGRISLSISHGKLKVHRTS